MASHVPCLKELSVSCPLGISACHPFCDALLVSGACFA